MMKLAIQNADDGGFDVFVNGDHYMRLKTHDEALHWALRAAAVLCELQFRDVSRESWEGKA